MNFEFNYLDWTCLEVICMIISMLSYRIPHSSAISSL